MTEKTHSDSEPLAFSDDRGARLPVILSAAMVLLLVLWFGSGLTTGAPAPAPDRASAPEAEVVVGIRRSEARPVQHVFAAEGHSLPARDVEVRAETSGDIAEVFVARGAQVGAGDLLARFDTATQAADLKRARANLDRARRDQDNADRLAETGAITQDRVVAIRSALADAEAQTVYAEDAQRRAEIRAPFAGRVEEFHPEPREFMAAGTPVARIVALDPLTVRVRVPQQAVASLAVGQTAQVRFITGEVRAGTVTFIGANAAQDTRTFEMEIAVANPDPAIPAGLSARVAIVTGATPAHFISPATLALDADGRIGLKAVGADGRVAFHPVIIARAETSGVWVTGVPDTLEIITVGQGFVQTGQTVAAVADDRPPPQPVALEGLK